MARRRWNIDTIQQIMDGENPFLQVGYTGKKIRHKEGDNWVDSKGLKWMMKNGAIIRVNEQADSIRELVKQKCSNCGFDVGMLGNKLDVKLYAKTGKCLDCVQAEELVKIIDGTYQSFVEEKTLKNKISTAKEFRKNVLESIDYLKKDDAKIEMVHQDGSMTTFVGAQNEKLLKEAEADLEKVNKLIEELETHVKSATLICPTKKI